MVTRLATAIRRSRRSALPRVPSITDESRSSAYVGAPPSGSYAATP
jgi:hypothetical protein